MVRLMTRVFVVALSVLTITFALNNAQAQDIHYSQTKAVLQSLNPALTGAFDHEWQAAINYRNQWRSVAIPSHPFTTTSAEYERQLYWYSQHFSWGFLFVNDKSGFVALTQQRFLMSLAYHKTINNNQFHVGIQPGYISKNYSFDGITFPNDWSRDDGVFVSGYTPINSNLANRLSYFDLSGGMAWDRCFKKIHPTVGFTIFHINKPNETFSGVDYKLPMRSMMYGACVIKLNPAFSVNTQIVQTFMSKASETLLSIEPEMQVKSAKVRSIFAGATMRTGFERNTDALSLMAGATMKNVRAAISYDFNISSLNVASNYRGGFEFSLIFKGLNTLIKTKSIPCEIY